MSDTPNFPSLTSTCCHYPLLAQQAQWMAELADTLQALKEKLSVVEQVNAKVDVIVKHQQKQNQVCTIETARQSARTEALINELEKARKREIDLILANKDLHETINGEVEKINEMLADHKALVELLHPSQAPDISVSFPVFQSTGLVFR